MIARNPGQNLDPCERKRTFAFCLSLGPPLARCKGPFMNIENDAGMTRQESARQWVLTLARYREPSTWRSLFELAVTLVPFLFLWGLAWIALDVSLCFCIMLDSVAISFE